MDGGRPALPRGTLVPSTRNAQHGSTAARRPATSPGTRQTTARSPHGALVQRTLRCMRDNTVLRQPHHQHRVDNYPRRKARLFPRRPGDQLSMSRRNAHASIRLGQTFLSDLTTWSLPLAHHNNRSTVDFFYFQINDLYNCCTLTFIIIEKRKTNDIIFVVCIILCQ